MNPRLQSRLNRIQTVAFMVGGAALVLAGWGALANRYQFFISYLFGYLFWLGLALGCFTVTMIHHLTGGRWGHPVRRFLEAGFGTLPVLAVLFIPICFGLRELYPWARPEEVSLAELLQKRGGYMSPAAFILRAIFFFGIWLTMTRFLRKWSLAQDHTADAAPARKLRSLSGPGLVIYPLTATFAYVDWIMSAEAHWFSTMFAVIVVIGQILVAYAFAILLLAFFQRHKPLSEVVSTTHYHHLGNLLLTFVLFWTYVSFGQLLIVYSGNLPHEIDWYLHRIAGNWKSIIALMALFHFFLPFFVLLFRPVKRNLLPLTMIAAILFVVHLLEIYWMVSPSYHQSGLRLHWMDFATSLGVGGIWIAMFLGRLKAAPLLPQNDPGQQFAFSYAHAH